MAFKRVAPCVYQLCDRGVNVFLLDSYGLTLIDTGFESTGPKIISALEDLGHDPSSVSRILLTHCHPDHAGSAAFLQERLGAEVLCHRFDAELLEQSLAIPKPFVPAPGLLNRCLFKFALQSMPSEVAALQIDRFLEEGEEVIGGIEVIHTPGHCAGHLSFLWNDILFVGDAAANIVCLRPPIAVENYELALNSIQRLAEREFSIACFGHGGPIRKRAGERFRARKWSESCPSVMEAERKRQVLWRSELDSW